jgi:hypothetical protein
MPYAGLESAAQLMSVAINDDAGLEREADAMGLRLHGDARASAFEVRHADFKDVS